MRQEKITSQDAATASLAAAVSDPIATLIDQREAELAAYKRKVAEVMTRYAREHNLCNVADQALAEVGLRRVERANVEGSATLKITWEQNADKRQSAKEAAAALYRVVRELIDFDGDVDKVSSYLEGCQFEGRTEFAIGEFTFDFAAGEEAPDAHLLPAGDPDTVAF